MLIFHEWCRQRFFNRPFAAVNTQVQGSLWQSYFLRPLCQGQFASLIQQQPVGAPVIRLPRSRFPHAVFLRVWAIVRQPFDGEMWGRPWTHICEKLLKGLPLTRNASSSISRIGLTGRIVTAVNDGTVNPIFRRLCFSVCPPPIPAIVVPKASTTQTIAMSQAIGFHGLDRSTVTLTYALRFFGAEIFHARQYCPPAKSLACHINNGLPTSWHGAFSMNSASMMRVLRQPHGESCLAGATRNKPQPSIIPQGGD